MKFKRAIALVTAVCLVVGGLNYIAKDTNDVEAAQTYTLAWSDEFEGTSLDTSVWSYETGNGSWGWGNGEVEYYTSRTDNVQVADGTLRIIAKKENYNGYEYTSGRIITKGKKSFTYGKMEARIKVENGNQSGLWPAFWMMGENYNSVGWPACGEIDIMEHANSNNTVGGCLHWWNYDSSSNADYGSGNANSDYVFSDNTNNGINGWHTYGLIWDEDHMEWQVDGETYFQQGITDNNSYCFSKNQFFLLNLAIGGTGTGYTNYQTADPNTYQTATMYVDYVRVYQLSDGSETTTNQTTTENTTTSSSDQQETETFVSYETVDSVASSNNVFETYYGSDWAGATGSSSNASNTGITMNVSSVGSDLWGVQAYLSDLEYIAGNTYTYKCTIVSDVTKNIRVKVVGDSDDYIFSQEDITVQAGVPYEYEVQVTIPYDYTGRLDLYFGLGRNSNDSGLTSSSSMTLTISDVSFVTEKEVITVIPVTPATTGESVADTGKTEVVSSKSASKTESSDASAFKQKKAKIRRLVSKKHGKVKVVIKKVANADGYIIRYCDNKKFRGYRKKKTTKSKVVIKGAGNGKKCWVKVRAYRMIDGKKVKGKWSKKKKVKIKK